VVFTPFFRYAFGIGALAVLFPMLVLISTATRLAADRREERFAALRLVGGTPGDIRIVATVEAVISAFLGAMLGTVIFLLVRPALAGAALAGTRYFESDLTPTSWGYLGMLVGVPAVAAIAALVSLRRVQISPLGVVRRATPRPPSFWRLIALVTGVGVYVYGLDKTSRNTIGVAAYPGLLLTMTGIVIAGPWLTAQAARLFGRLAGGSSALLAARRLADNPKRAYRAVTGLTLARSGSAGRAGDGQLALRRQPALQGQADRRRHFPGVHRQRDDAAGADSPRHGEQPRDARAGPHLPGRPRAAGGGRQPR
jgi:hypothetical protein